MLWTQANVWSELKRYDLARLNAPLETDKIFYMAESKPHAVADEGQAAHMQASLQKLLGDARARFPLAFNVAAVDNSDISNETLADRLHSLNLSRHDRDILEAYVAGLIHSPGEHGSAQMLQSTAIYFGSYEATLETAGTWSIQGGTKGLADAILNESKAKLRISTPVKSVSDDGSSVTVTTGAGDKIHS